jgi:ADP-ribose pyrophosphatase YjhB (NUDIX family)
MNNINPRVGVAVIIRNKKNEILLGYRKNINLGYHTWGLPGGKLDFGEDLKDCAIRELKEETNLTVDYNNLVLAGVTNAIFD